MEKSESIAELAKALALVQGQIKGAVKTSENPFFKAKYADLSSVWEACRKPLSANNLAVVQTTDFIDGYPGVIIETMLLHSSGEWIKGRLGICPAKTDPQSMGSAITYARRYALAAIVGIAPEDDDAEGATEHKEPPVSKRQASPSAITYARRLTGGKNEEVTVKVETLRVSGEDLKRFGQFLKDRKPPLEAEDLPKDENLGCTLKEWLRRGKTIEQAIDFLSTLPWEDTAALPQEVETGNSEEGAVEDVVLPDGETG